MKHQNGQSTVARLFSQLKGQRIRLAVVAVSILIYVGLIIYTPMFSAVVIDHLWQSIQAAWNDGVPFSITWTNMGQELTQLSIQYFFTWIFLLFAILSDGKCSREPESGAAKPDCP